MIGNTRFDSPSYHIVFHAVPVRDPSPGHPGRQFAVQGGHSVPLIARSARLCLNTRIEIAC